MIKIQLADHLKELDEVDARIAALVRNAVANSLGAGTVLKETVAEVVRDVISGTRAATELTGAELATGMKGVAKGVLLGVHDVRGDLSQAASEMVHIAIRQAASAGADASMVARRAMDGIREAAVDTGENARAIVQTALDRAIHGATRIGTSTARTVRDVLLGVVADLDSLAAKSAVKPSAEARRRRAPNPTMRSAPKPARTTVAQE